VQELITNAFSNMGQPEFELIELEKKQQKKTTNMRNRFVVVTPTALASRIGVDYMP